MIHTGQEWELKECCRARRRRLEWENHKVGALEEGAQMLKRVEMGTLDKVQKREAPLEELSVRKLVEASLEGLVETGS